MGAFCFFCAHRSGAGAWCTLIWEQQGRSGIYITGCSPLQGRSEGNRIISLKGTTRDSQVLQKDKVTEEEKALQAAARAPKSSEE